MTFSRDDRSAGRGVCDVASLDMHLDSHRVLSCVGVEGDPLRRRRECDDDRYMDRLPPYRRVQKRGGGVAAVSGVRSTGGGEGS